MGTAPKRKINFSYFSIVLALISVFQSKILFGSEVSIPDTSIVTNTQFSIPILTSDLTGMGIASFDCKIIYNDSLLEYVGFSTNNSLSSGFLIAVNDSISGEVIVSAAGNQSIAGGGVLFYLTFNTKSDTGQAVVAFESFMFLESIFPTTKNGTVEIVSDIVVSVDSDDIQANRPATGFALYPNPFNGSITIAYNLQTTTQLVINIFNLNGEKVRTIFNGLQSEGNHVLMWDGKSVNNIQVASGIYFCRLTTNNYTQAIRITYIK